MKTVVVGAWALVIALSRFATLLSAQTPCSFAISPSNGSHNAGTSTGLVSVTTAAGCAWNVINTNAWISLLSGSNGVGNGTVSYGVSPNPASSARVGYFLIGDQSFAVTQQGAPCDYAFSPGGATVEHAASTNYISVTTSPDCVWRVTNHDISGHKNTEWIDILSEGANNTGSGTVAYVVRDLPATYWRTGFFLIAGRIFTITQKGIPCNYGIAATNRTYGAGATNDSVEVTAADICSWSVGSGDDWITILSGPGGSGPASVSYALAANPGPEPRTGGIFFAGQFWLQITQASDPMIVTQPTNQTVAPGGTAVFNVEVAGTAPFTYQWYFGSTPLADGNGISGATTSTLALTDVQTSQAGGYWVATSNSLRGTVSATASLTVSCGYTLPSHSANVGSISSTNFIVINGDANTNCPWNIVNTNSWVTILPGLTNTGSGTIAYLVATNPTLNTRNASILIADQTFSIVQAGSPPAISLAEALDTGGTLPWYAYGTGTPAWFGQSLVSHDGVDAAQSGPVGDNGYVTVYTAVIGPGRISFWWKVSSEPGNDKLVFYINGVEKARISGEVDWQLRSLPITTSFSNTLQWTYSKNAGGAAGLDRGWLDQVRFLPGTGCVVTLSQTNAAYSWYSATGQVSVTAATNCTWAVDNTNSWITPLTDVAQGNGYFLYSVSPASSAASRSGVVLIGGQPFTIVQQGAPDCITTLSQTNATHSWNSETGQVSVTAATNCAWAVVNTNSWITPLPGVVEGSGDFRYIVSAASSAASRSGVVVIGGQPFTIVQQGAPCTLSISPAGQTFDFPGGGGSINVTTPIGCPWNVVNTNDWVTITNFSSSGSGGINYLVAANTNSFARSGNIRVGDQLHFISQEVTIDEALDTAGTPLVWSASQWKAQPGVTHDGVDAAQSFGIPGIVGVRSILDLHIPGPGTLSFWWKVSNNPTGIYVLRFLVYGVSQAVIKGEVDWQQVTVTIPAQSYAYYQVQWVYDSGFDGPWSNCAWIDHVQFVPAIPPGNTNPPACTISISPTNRSHGYANATNTVGVTTQNGCAWSVVTSNSWISILSSLNNSNSGTVAYTLAPNTNSQARSGSILIGGQGFLLTQSGAPRLQLVSQTPTNTTLSVQGNAGSMYVVECSTDLVHWTPISTNSTPSLVTDAPVADTPRRFYRTVEIP